MTLFLEEVPSKHAELGAKRVAALAYSLAAVGYYLDQRARLWR